MSAIRQYERVINADAGPDTESDVDACAARRSGATETARFTSTVEEARSPRLFDLPSAGPRYLCIGLAVIRI